MQTLNSFLLDINNDVRCDSPPDDPIAEEADEAGLVKPVGYSPDGWIWWKLTHRGFEYVKSNLL